MSNEAREAEWPESVLVTPFGIHELSSFFLFPLELYGRAYFDACFPG